MRIKLEVLRQDLPPVKVLWSVTPHMLASQLLEKIDEHFPLESDDWGFEDYAVQLDGYEILHYMPLDNLLDQDSHVTLVPFPLPSPLSPLLSCLPLPSRHVPAAVAAA